MSRSEQPPHTPEPVGPGASKNPKPEPNAKPETSVQPTVPTRLCACGHARKHYSVSAEAEYSAWGWFCNLFGITAHPRRLHYRCRQCDQVFDATDNVDELKGHV